MPCIFSKPETTTEVSGETPKTTEAPETAETGKLEAYNAPTSSLKSVHTLPISIRRSVSTGTQLSLQKVNFEKILKSGSK